MPAITIKDVAKSARVSIGTVSMVLNKSDKVKNSTRNKVLLAAEKLGYRPNKYARLLRSKHSKVMGLIVTHITNPFFGSIIDNVQDELACRDYDLMLGITKGSTTLEEHFVNKFIEMQVDGILIVPTHKGITNNNLFLKLEKYKIPFCFITSYYPDINASCVMTDLCEGSYLLTKHLLETGHRKIIHIVSNLDNPTSSSRVEGYLRAYKESEHQFSSEWIVKSEPSFQGGYDAAAHFINGNRPDAIITMNDIMAFGVLQLLKKADIRVPQDISVAGYDDLLYTSLLETPLTTVRQPMIPMCQKAVELIINKVTAPDEINQRILLQPHLVIRNSTADRRSAAFLE